MRDLKKTLLKYGITTAAAGLVTGLILHGRNFAAKPTLLEQYKILVDAFFVPGIVLVMFALLVWSSTQGAFDFFGYAISRIGGMFLPAHGALTKHETYYEYIERKRGKRASSFWFLAFVGLAFVAVSTVFLILYYAKK